MNSMEYIRNILYTMNIYIYTYNHIYTMTLSDTQENPFFFCGSYYVTFVTNRITSDCSTGTMPMVLGTSWEVCWEFV